MDVVGRFEVEIKPREIEPPGGGWRVRSGFEIFIQPSHHRQTQHVFQTLVQQLNLRQKNKQNFNYVNSGLKKVLKDLQVKGVGGGSEFETFPSKKSSVFLII